jgi:hypothetical protein
MSLKLYAEQGQNSRLFPSTGENRPLRSLRSGRQGQRALWRFFANWDSNDDDLELLAHIGRNGIAFWYGQVAADGRVYGGPCVGRSDRICLPAHPTDDAVRDGLLQEDGWRL